jgi:hypothetical protein
VWPALLLCADYASVRRKIDQIEMEKLPAGSRVLITPAEANLYAAVEVRKAVADGIRAPRVAISTGTATGSGWVDFVKVQTSRGQPPGLLATALLSGEKHVSVTVTLKSSGGQARVDVQKVTIAGIPISGALLDLMIEYYLVPRYPEVVIGRPFQLRHKVDRIDLSPRGIDVLIGK